MVFTSVLQINVSFQNKKMVLTISNAFIFPIQLTSLPLARVCIRLKTNK